MSNSLCKCGSSKLEVDRARGITYCTECGDVVEESIIVSEVQIEEGAGGGVNVVGQFVGENSIRGTNINGLQHSLRESTEVTLQNGKRLINEMSSQLRLNQHCIETAFNFYKLALKRGLTRGRKIRQVIAACLYLVCRTEGTPHMLLDLCDIVHDDSCYISSLGKLAMKFAHLLCIKLPEIDPGLFIPRFAHKLDFGDKTHEVTYTALRLVQRMNRDWMATGRRPSGLCGAALLVSARMYDFHRSLDDIVKVVKIGKTTLRKRMNEFEDTPSSMLTLDEFHTVDLEDEADPPAFTRAQKLNKIRELEQNANIEELEKEISELQENIEAELKKLQKPRGLMAKYAKLNEIEDEILGPNHDLTNIDAEIEEAEEFLSDEQLTLIRSIVDDSGNEKILSDEGNLLQNFGLRPSLESLGLMRNDSNDSLVQSKASNVSINEEDEELDLEGIDDGEIDSMILTRDEIKTKAKLWLRANKDWLKEQKEKEEQKRKVEEELKSGERAPKAKRQRTRRPKNLAPVSNPQEAIDRMLQEKKISSKINYDVLKNLNKDLKNS